jgi:trehalose utilization protein
LPFDFCLLPFAFPGRPDQGLTETALAQTDVLIWFGHVTTRK